MKSFITPTYIFTPGVSGVGTIDLSSISNFDIKRLVAIINITTNTIIYNVANFLAGFNAVNGAIITLDFDTSSMSSNDLLQIIYDTDDAITNNELIEAIQSLRMSINALNKSGAGLSTVDTGGRLRVLIDAITANLTLSNVTTLSNQTSVGGYAANDKIPALMSIRSGNIRNNINVT